MTDDRSPANHADPADPTARLRSPSAPSRAERRAARLDDPRFESVRNRPVRRRLVLALVGLLVIETALFLAFDVVEPVASLVAVLVSLLIVMGSFVLLLGMLKVSTRGVEELPRSVLDERERQVRGEVYAWAYRIGAAALTVLLAAAAVWASVGLPVGTGIVVATVVVTFHVLLVLPTMVAAWLAD